MGGDGRPRGVDAKDNADDEFVGTWKDGGVASGNVVNRTPVETERISALVDVWKIFQY